MPAKKFIIPFAATGDKTAVPNTLQPDGTVSYAQGFGPDYELDKTLDPVNAKDVPRDQTNQIYFDLTDAVGEQQLYGVSLWGADRAPYPINARAYHNDKLWRSSVINNSGEPGVSGWEDVSVLSDTVNAPIATVAAAGTINLTTGAPNTSQLLISGAGVTINGFTVAANRFFVARIAGANTLVNSASLVTNTSANIVTEANDSVLLRATAANTVEVVAYFSRIPLSSGFAQTTQNLTGSRLSNTIYTNTTKRPIVVYVTTIYGVAVSILRVDGVQAGIAGGNGTDALATASVTVPPGSTYEFASGGVPLLWTELR